jgi:hypothetical protein
MYLGSVLGPKCNNDIGWFGLMGRQTGEVGIGPVGNIHNLTRLHSRLKSLSRLHDVEPAAVEEESVIAEQPIQLRERWMIVGNGLSLELPEGSFDLCGR